MYVYISVPSARSGKNILLLIYMQYGIIRSICPFQILFAKLLPMPLGFSSCNVLFVCHEPSHYLQSDDITRRVAHCQLNFL